MRRWKWFTRGQGVEVVGTAEPVELPADPVPPPPKPAWNQPTAIFDRVPLTPAALYRVRSASWRWPQ